MTNLSKEEIQAKTLMNPDGTYMTEAQIMADLPSRIDPDGFATFLKMPTDELIWCHHGLGQWIRNSYGLWHEWNPYVILQDAQHDNFPDQISQRIIETLHATLNKAGSDAYSRAMKAVDDTTNT